MNELKVFSNEEFGELGVLMIDGKVFFPATRAARLLGYVDPYDAIKRHTKGSVKHRVLTKGGEQNMTFIPEGDLYRLITHSKLPDAERFESWIFDVVVPTIHHCGMYATPEAIEKILTDPKALIVMLQTIQAEREQRLALETQIEQDKPFTNFGKAMDVSSGTILIGEFAKLVCNSGINVGRTRLFRWLRDRGYLMKDNRPYQRYVDRGLFAVREYNIFSTKGDMVKTTTLVTGKGQRVLLEELQKIPSWEKARDL